MRDEVNSQLLRPLSPIPHPGSRIPLRERLQAAEQILLARHPDDLIPELAILEKEERRNRAHVVLHREALVLIDVHLGHFDRSRLLLGDFVEKRRDHFARAAPFGPEIDQHRLLALGYFLVKIRIVQSECSGVFHAAKIRRKSRFESENLSKRSRIIPSERWAESRRRRPADWKRSLQGLVACPWRPEWAAATAIR